MLPCEHGQHHEQCAVKSFNQPITSRMIWSRAGFMSPQQEAQFLHKMILKLAGLPESTGGLGGPLGARSRPTSSRSWRWTMHHHQGLGVYVYYWSRRLTPQPGSVTVSRLETFCDCSWRNCHTWSSPLSTDHPGNRYGNVSSKWGHRLTPWPDWPHEKHTIVVQSLRVEIGLKRGTDIGVPGGNGRRGPVSLTVNVRCQR